MSVSFLSRRKRSMTAAILLIYFFSNGALRNCVVLAAPRVGESPLVVVSFDFKTEILGERSSISVSVVSINTGTGAVTLNGGDTGAPSVPFTWDWGDGTVTTGWFPQSHTYLDRTRNYIVKVTSHYSGGKTGSAEALVRFIRPAVTPTPLPSDIAVSVPNSPVNLISARASYGIPAGLSYFDDSFFTGIDRSVVEYILTVAASIQKDCVNSNLVLIDGGFRQVVLRDPSFQGMHSLWYTSPVAFVAGDSMWQGSIPWSSFFHEMGHDMTLNSPSNYYYGGKTDGDGNAIFSESMAQIFQHATAYEIVNAGTYGLSNDIVFEIKQSARDSIVGVRNSYDRYVSSGMQFASWNDPNTPNDETFDTFMTVAYRFFVHAENSGLGYRIPLKKMMNLLQTFREADKVRYDSSSNSPSANTFRATLMVAALSYGFGEDLRTEFRNLNFPISDEIYNELIQRVGAGAHWGQSDSRLPYGNIMYNGLPDGGVFVDLNNDGRVDYVFMNSGPGRTDRHIYINTGSGWQEDNSWLPPFGNIVWNGKDDGARFSDLNRDGYPDYIFMNSGPTWSNRHVYLNTGSGSAPHWTQTDSWLPPHGNIIWNGQLDGGVFVDLNHDGYEDFVFMNSGPTWGDRHVYINSHSGWSQDDSWLPPFGNIIWNGKDDGARFADLNGDGYPDYVFMNSGPMWGNRRVYINTASGSSPHWTQADSWIPPFGNIIWNGQYDGAVFVDLSNDGYADYVFMNSGPTWSNRRVYINTHSGWSQDDSWLPPFGNIVWNGKEDGARFADLNGGGYPDYMFMNSGPTWSNRHMYYNVPALP